MSKKNNIPKLLFVGIGHHQEGRLQKAQSIYEQILSLDPRHFDALHLQGVIAAQTQNLNLALDLIGKAIKINPNMAQAHLGKAQLLNSLKHHTEALESVKTALQKDPELIEACLFRAEILNDMKRYSECIEILENIHKKTGHYYSSAFYLHAKMMICKWSHFHEDIEKLKSIIHRKTDNIYPFLLLSKIDDPNLHKNTAIFFNKKSNSSYRKFISPPLNSEGKIKIAYFSSDFKDHPISYLMAEVFELHDRDHFFIIGISLFKNKEGSFRDGTRKIDVEVAPGSPRVRTSRVFQVLNRTE
jgi:predicted O-linked N-acetylglucosamine transferase (SPINDLY family)